MNERTMTRSDHSFFWGIAAFLITLAILAFYFMATQPALASCDPRVEQHDVDSPNQFDPPPAQSLSPTSGGTEPVTVYYDSVTNQRCNPQ